MAQPLTLNGIEAEGTGGLIRVGNYSVQIHPEHGAVVVHEPEGPPAPRLRALPVLRRPRAVRGLLDRQEDIAAALAALGNSLPVGIHGPSGIGKTTLLRHLAHATVGTLPDGVVHLAGFRQPAEDVLQSLFEAFYDCDVPCKPTPAQARQLLQGRKALVLLDDAEFGHEAAESLLDQAPDCAFVLATRERCLWGECRAIGLGGLPAEDARALFERELGRSLTGEEAPAFESLHARLEGHPLRLLQAAAQVREGRPLAEVETIREGNARRTLAALPDEEKRILSTLAALGGGPVGGAHMAALADVADALAVLDALQERKLVQAHSPRYSLTGDLDRLLPSIWDLSPWCERALAYFLSWAEARREDPAALLEEADALRRLLDWTAAAGRPAETLRLGRVLEPALAVSGRWGAWAQVLERIRAAAEALRDRTVEAWALHQLGTRLLCLGDRAAARQLLTRALALRQSLGDRAAAAVTRDNLGLLGPLPSRWIMPQVVSFRYLPLLAGAFLFLVLLLGGIRLWSSRVASADRSTETAAPVASSPRRNATNSASSILLREATPDLTTDMASPITTDLEPADGKEPMLDLPRSVEFPALVLGAESGPQGQTISVTNAGTAPLRVAGISFVENPGQAFTLRSNCTRGPIPSAGRCLVQIFFHPPAPGSYHGVLAVDAQGVGRQTLEVSGLAREPEREPPPREPQEESEPPAATQGWCCVDGEVYQSTDAACEDEEGTFFARQRAAIAACLMFGCCLDGEFRLGEKRERCDELDGIFMSAVEVPQRCRRP